MPQHNYMFAPARELWPLGSINARLPPVQIGVDKEGKPVFISAAAWLDQHKPVEQMTWAPSLPMIIKDRLISEGGWIRRKKVSCFNLYRPPLLARGNPDEAGRWIAHVQRVYPENADHIIKWLAHRVQRPQEKINHALVFGGLQGIGKDSLIEPVKRAVGPWNVAEPSPTQLLERFNGFARSVILRISEAHDLGELDRYQFYERLKVYTAAPPDVLRVDEKNLREYNLLNCCGVIITTNHKTDGLYLPADDRRHYVINAAHLRQAAGWLAVGCLVFRHLGETPARRPRRDLHRLLWEADHQLGRAAYGWLGLPAPEQLAPQARKSHAGQRPRFGHGEPDLNEFAAVIPNIGYGWEEWNKIGLAFFAASGGSEEDRRAFDAFSGKSSKYSPAAVNEHWTNFGRWPPSNTGIGKLLALAWEARR